MTFRPPIITRIWPRTRAAAQNAAGSVAPNPNLYGGGLEPFYQTDFPNPPRGKPFPFENRTFLWEGNTLLGGGLAPFAQLQWPNPRGYRFPLENRTFIDEGNALLLGAGTVASTTYPQLERFRPRGLTRGLAA